MWRHQSPVLTKASIEICPQDVVSHHAWHGVLAACSHVHIPGVQQPHGKFRHAQEVHDVTVDSDQGPPEPHQRAAVQVGVKALAGSDFSTALAVMEDMGLLRMGAGWDRSKRRWSLRADADDITSAFQAVRILQPVLPS